MVFGPIGKTRWPPWPLIDWDIFDFSSVTGNWNSTKLERKQDLNVLHQAGVFRAAWKNKMEFNKIHMKQDLNVFYHVGVFRTDRRNKIANPASDWLRHFRLLLWNHWMEFNKIWQDARSQRPLISLCFSGRSEEQDGRPASDLPRHFRLLLLDRWTRFNETWQEARSQCPLPILCYSAKKRPPWPLVGWDIFDSSTVTAAQNSTKLDRKENLNVLYQVRVIRRNLTGSKISTSSTKFVFFGPIGKTRWPPRTLIGWDIFDFSSERNSTKLDRK